MKARFPARAAAILLVGLAPEVIAQGPPSPGTPTVVPAASSSCLVGHTALGAATGGLLGAWLGFVTAKIRVSDWNDAARSASGIRMRNQSTIIGAALGLAVGSFVGHRGGCGTSAMLPRTRLGQQAITSEEIAKSGQGGNVYDLVHSLRPTWLNTRGQTLSEGAETYVLDGQAVTVQGTIHLGVYLDNARLGSIDDLKTIPVAGITGVRYYDAGEASMRWGLNNSSGAIQVTTTDVSVTSP